MNAGFHSLLRCGEPNVVADDEIEWRICLSCSQFDLPLAALYEPVKAQAHLSTERRAQLGRHKKAHRHSGAMQEAPP